MLKRRFAALISAPVLTAGLTVPLGAATAHAAPVCGGTVANWESFATGVGGQWGGYLGDEKIPVIAALITLPAYGGMKGQTQAREFPESESYLEDVTFTSSPVPSLTWKTERFHGGTWTLTNPVCEEHPDRVDAVTASFTDKGRTWTGKLYADDLPVGAN
ncbi:hypothetical protein ABT160_07800 [Streptomyces sp. NPDC001941]|uniref:hypothetical protein n=1 Tax=Streptomyces sp. NPDC001941 TaxID=3154659 RepID=UPI00332BF41B